MKQIPTGQRRFACLVWWALLAVGVVALLYGFPAGDVTDAEANGLLQANSILRGSEDVSNPVSGYGAMLAVVHTVWSQDVTPASARLLSFVAVLLSVAMVDILLRLRVGVWSAATAGLVTVCSFPAIVLSQTATVDAILAAAVIGSVTSISQIILASGRGGRVGWGCVLLFWLGVSAVSVAGIEVVGTFTKPADRGVSLFLALAAASPWLCTWIVCATPTYWQTLSKQERACTFTGASLALLGVAMGFAMPARWLAGSMVLLAGCSLASGCCWQRWLAGSLAPSIHKLQERCMRFVLLGAPLTLAVVGTWRIFECYNFMERVQAIVVVSLIAAFAAAWLSHKRMIVGYFVPLLMLLVACKFGYIHVYLPERDHWHSPKAQALALQRQIDAGSKLYTDFSTSAAFRYYLDRQVLPLGNIDDNAVSDYAFVTEYDAPDTTAGNWEVVRYFDGPVQNRMALMKRSAVETAAHASQIKAR